MMQSKMKSVSEDSTESKLVVAAEKLFAVNGFHGTSIRAICRSAGCGKASVHYYFKIKDQLVLAVLESRMPSLAARRAEMLDTLDSADCQPSVQSIVETIIIPMVELIKAEGDSGWDYIKFMAKLLHERPDLIWVIYDKYNSENSSRQLKGLLKALPQISSDVIQRRLVFGATISVDFLANPIDFSPDGLRWHQRDLNLEYYTHLTNFVAGGLSAP